MNYDLLQCPRCGVPYGTAGKANHNCYAYGVSNNTTMSTQERQQAELLESVARRTIEALMSLYKEEMRMAQRVMFSDGAVEIKYSPETQSIEITRPETKDKNKDE